jgi:hypothetical protein
MVTSMFENTSSTATIPITFRQLVAIALRTSIAHRRLVGRTRDANAREYRKNQVECAARSRSIARDTRRRRVIPNASIVRA